MGLDWSLGGFKGLSGVSLGVSGNYKTIADAFLEAKMVSVSYLYFFVVSGGPWVVSNDVLAASKHLEKVSGGCLLYTSPSPRDS